MPQFSHGAPDSQTVTYTQFGPQKRKLKTVRQILVANTSAYPILWRRQWHPTPVLLPGKSHGGRSLVGCSSWDREELETTEQLHFLFSLSCIGEGNGNPLQCSCLENPRDGGAWWAAVYGVTQSWTRLKRLSSSSSILSSGEEHTKTFPVKTDLIPGSGRSPGGGNGNPLLYS